MIGCLAETTTCVVAKPLVYIKGLTFTIYTCWDHETFFESLLEDDLRINKRQKNRTAFLVLGVISILASTTSLFLYLICSKIRIIIFYPLYYRTVIYYNPFKQIQRKREEEGKMRDEKGVTALNIL